MNWINFCLYVNYSLHQALGSIHRLCNTFSILHILVCGYVYTTFVYISQGSAVTPRREETMAFPGIVRFSVANSFSVCCR